MLTRVLFGLVIAVVMAARTATAENLALSGTDQWVAIASRQDLNEAISIAKTYAAQKSRVVRSRNGWFAVVLGPYPTSDISSFLRDYHGPQLPRDAMLTGGTGYVETVWQSPVVAAGPSVAGSSPDWPSCSKVENAEASIRACTNIIDANTEVGENLSIAYANRGAAFANKGDLDRAVADLDKAIELKPDSAEAYTNRGNAYDSKRDFGRAIADHSEAIQLRPDFADAYYNRGVSYAHRADWDRAIADYDRAIQLRPDDAGAYITEAQPNEIHWLTFDEAEQNGIDVRIFPSG